MVLWFSQLHKLVNIVVTCEFVMSQWIYLVTMPALCPCKLPSTIHLHFFVDFLGVYVLNEPWRRLLLVLE